jgi:two-component system, OmpR family, phosphate regulon sensor histidine kinase PhoR
MNIYLRHLLRFFVRHTVAQAPVSSTHKQNKTDTAPHYTLAILNAIAEPIIILDKNAVVILANTAAKLRLPNIAYNNPISFGLRDPSVLEAVESAQKGVTSIVQYNERNSIEYFYDVSITPIENPVGQECIIILMRDITRLQRMEHMRVDFVANASHELRTPLASILGFIETLQGSAKADSIAREKFLNIMGTQARRMSRLVDDLLALSRIELTQHVAPNAIVNVIEVVKTMVDSLMGLARERGVELNIQSLPNEQFMVCGDKDELLRVFENLIENAIKYGQSGKRVDVALGKTQDNIEIAVRDYGQGIAPEHLPRLTERFYRANEMHSREQSGTGLGLAIVKHIVSRHKGELKIESVLGKGAKFTILIPRIK